jgi:predicted nucleic acid-binding protein
MIAIDTNIWLYCHDVRDPRKQKLAKTLVRDSLQIALPWQVGCEFIAASRKLGSAEFSIDLAWKSLATKGGMVHQVILPRQEHWDQCYRLVSTHGFSFWDGLLVACCLDAGVQTLFTEDMGGMARIEGMAIENPFKGGTT